MSKRQDDLSLLDLIEGQLDSSSTEELIQQLREEDKEQELKQYRAIVGLEQLVAAQQPLPSLAQSQQILAAFSGERLEEAARQNLAVATDEDFSSIRADHLQSLSRLRNSYRAMLTANAALMLVLISLLWTRAEELPLTQSAGIIPEGYVLVSLDVPLDAKTVTPFGHVDLKVSYHSSGHEIVRDLGRYLQVHAIEPVLNSSTALSRLTILMPESQASDVRYARILGELEISPITPVSRTNSHESIVRDPAGRAIALGENQMPAVLYMNRGSSSSARLVYRDGYWIEDPHVRIRAF